MNLQEDLKKNTGKEGENLGDREEKSRIEEKRKVRAKMILLNSGLALIIIIIVLAGKLISLNTADNKTAAVSEKTVRGMDKEDKQKESKKKEEKPKPEAAKKPEAVQTAAGGTERWIRKDLDAKKPMVALTFDDGPYAPVTNKILATLKAHDAKATFFCVGNRIPGYSDVVKKAYNQGCQLASHTYEHKVLSTAKKKQITWQLKKTDSVLQNVIGCHTTALRPPGGFVNDKVRKTVNVPMVCWNVDSEDWKSRNTKKVLKRCNSIEDGDIVLMHDLYPTTAKAVAVLVPKLRKKGFQLVTVDELFYYKGIKAKAGEVYYSGK